MKNECAPVVSHFSKLCNLVSQEEFELTRARPDPVPPPAKPPPKKAVGRFKAGFVEKRREALEVITTFRKGAVLY